MSIGRATLRVGLVVAVAGAVAWGGWAAYRKLATDGIVSTSSAGRLTVDDSKNLGSVQNGTFVNVPITLSNTGGMAIALEQFHSDCSCIKIYQMIDDIKRDINRLVIEPGATATIFADIRVSGNAGESRISLVRFREADGEPGLVHQVQVRYTPVTRVYCLPRSLAFGDVPAGTSASGVVEIRSDGTLATPTGAVTSSSPDRYTVSFSLPSEEQSRVFRTANPGQHLVGRVGLALKGTDPGSYDEEVVVLVGGAELIRLTVSAQVTGDYTLYPETIVLPRTNSGGDRVYAATVSARSRAGRPARIELVGPAESPFSGTSPSPDSGMTLKYTGRPESVTVPQTHLLKLKVSGDGPEVVLTLPVTVLPAK